MPHAARNGVRSKPDWLHIYVIFSRGTDMEINHLGSIYKPETVAKKGQMPVAAVWLKPGSRGARPCELYMHVKLQQGGVWEHDFELHNRRWLHIAAQLCKALSG